MASKCADKLKGGEEINGKGYVLKFIKLKEMPNGKARICMSDGEGKELGNLIVKQDTFNGNKMQAGDLVEIVKANKLALKNGNPAYVLQKWNVKPKPEIKPVQPNPTTFGSSRAAAPSSSSSGDVTKLNAISPYSSSWVAEVRILKKEPIREWNNARGQGRLQKYIISDESGKMQMTLWKEDIDRFSFCEVDKIYRLSGAQVKPADKKWNRTGMDYELSSNNNTRFEEAVGVKMASSYTFIKLAELADKEVDSNVDVVAMVYEVEEPAEFQSKHNEKTYFRRNFQLVDDSGISVRATLWGKTAEEFTATKGCAIEVSGATVREWQSSKNLNFNNDTIFKVKDEMDECIPETTALFQWWEKEGQNQTFTGVGGGSGGAGGKHQVSWADVKSVPHVQTLGNGDAADYADVRCWISFFARRDSCYYKADPETRKKVMENGEGGWQTVDGKQVENAENRLLLNGIKLTDTEDELWASAFHDECQALLGCEADDVVAALERGESDSIFNKALFKEFIFRMKIKEEFYQDTPRKRFTIMRCTPVNYEEYGEAIYSNLTA